LHQSNSSIPISIIKRNGKLSMIKVTIEWNGVLDCSDEFKEASFVQFQEVVKIIFD
jgi:hypothetical protein